MSHSLTDTSHVLIRTHNTEIRYYSLPYVTSPTGTARLNDGQEELKMKQIRTESQKSDEGSGKLLARTNHRARSMAWVAQTPGIESSNPTRGTDVYRRLCCVLCRQKPYDGSKSWYRILQKGQGPKWALSGGGL